MNSENLQAEGEQKNNVFKVTPLSKYLAMALFTILPFLGGYLGYTFAPEKIMAVEKVVVKQVPIPYDLLREKTTESEILQPENTMQVDSVGIDVSAEYQSSKYRVVRVVDNPYYSVESKYESLIITAPRGINDYTCGGKYVPSTCYLFLESSYYGIDSPQFVGTWSGGSPSLLPETVKFISPTVIEFKAVFGDAGYSMEAVWQLDTTTGSSTLISQEGTSPDEL